MRRIAFVSVLLATLVGCARRGWPPGASAWKQVDSFQCDFVARLPGRSVVREWTDPRGVKVLEYTTVAGEYLYMAQCLSAGQARRGEDADALVRARLQFEKDSIDRQHWPILEATLVPLGKCPGYRLVSVNPSGLEVSTRYVWAGDRAFLLGASGPKGQQATATARATLFESLQSKLCQ
jgi:hypothetical protein